VHPSWGLDPLHPKGSPLITVTLTPKGTVGLKPGNAADMKTLRTLSYVKRKKGLGVTFWTYLVDVRRDVPKGRLKWAPHVLPRLKRLRQEIANAKKGNDAEVLKAFGKLKPYPFQIEAIHAGLNTKRLLIADDTGLGKTIEMMGIALVLFRRREIKRAIFVVPAGLKIQWYEELDLFAKNCPGPIVVANGTAAKRAESYKKPWRILIINPELVWRDEHQLEKLVNGVGFVAFDEASCIRNPDTKTARSMKYLFDKTPYRIAATATPLENRLADLWSIFEFVDPRVFLSRRYFDSRYIVWQKKKFMVFSKRLKRKVRIVKEEPLRYRNLSEVRSKIAPCFIRRKVSDVGLQLPGLVVGWETLKMGSRQQAVYDAVKDKIAPKLKGLRGAALRMPLQALRQACNSTALVEKKGQGKPTHVKIDRLRELLETELAGEQVIVFTDYERFATLLKQELSQYKPVCYTGKMNKRDRQRSISAFRIGDRKLLIGTRALERGHNLQNAAVVVNIDLPFNPASIKQRLGRVRRLGSKHGTCRMINMIATGTVEERLILRRIYTKRKLFEGVFEEDELTHADPLANMVGEDLREFL